MDSIIKDAMDYAKTIFAGDCSGHDYFHTLRVYRMAVRIAQVEKADLQIVQLAALLHDVDDWKLSEATCEKKENAISFMRKHDLPQEQIETVCAIVGEISFIGEDSVVPRSIEGKCVQDADRLDALGAIGIARAFAYGGRQNRQLYNPDIPPRKAMKAEEYRSASGATTVNHFYEKLFRLQERMNTNTAKEIAQRRERFLQIYLDEFFAEWDGKR